MILDITRPHQQSEVPLPVAIWIHGGGFTSGWGQDLMLNMTNYALNGVIGIKINYRLGGLGFMNHVENGKTVGGNYGLLDMQMAIKFVVDNCHAIGCDPDNVSIFGESAGGAAIAYLIMGHEISPVSVYRLRFFKYRILSIFTLQFINHLGLHSI